MTTPGSANQPLPVLVPELVVTRRRTAALWIFSKTSGGRVARCVEAVSVDVDGGGSAAIAPALTTGLYTRGWFGSTRATGAALSSLGGALVRLRRNSASSRTPVNTLSEVTRPPTVTLIGDSIDNSE